MELWGCPNAAAIWTAAAHELEVFAREHELETLTLTQAEAESGYSKDHLSRLIAGGQIENVGKKGAPRTRRADLPRKPKPGERTPRLENGDPDLAGEVLRQRGLMDL